MNKTSFGQINSIEVSKQKVPLVVQKCTTGKFAFVGFIPALKLEKVYANSTDECLSLLKELLTKKLKSMALSHEPFPFFPNKDEIVQEYGNVEHITFVKLTSSKKQ